MGVTDVSMYDLVSDVIEERLTRRRSRICYSAVELLCHRVSIGLRLQDYKSLRVQSQSKIDTKIENNSLNQYLVDMFCEYSLSIYFGTVKCVLPANNVAWIAFLCFTAITYLCCIVLAQLVEQLM